MQQVRTMIAGRRAVAGIVSRAAFAVGCAVLVCACNTDRQITGAPTVPSDYRLRHPITIKEADRTLKVFIGANRGSLTPVQRAQVLEFAQNWKNEATGGVIIDLPVGTANEHSAAAAAREIASILAATGVPPQSMVLRNYRVTPGTFAPVRITYPRVTAEAGPCGLWPKDIGPSMNRDYFENQPPWNFGCTMQRNLAAMVANPSDLVEPRAETPAYAMRRTMVLEKYRQGVPTASTQAQSGTTGKITTVGQ
jgi:pilus assembly protein CpaD